MTFEQKEAEILNDAWARFKRLVRNCLHNGISDCVQMEVFYGGLNRPLQSLADASTAEGLMDKTYTEVKAILDTISRSTDEWVNNGYGMRSTDRRRAQARMIEADVATSLMTQMAIVTSLLKTMALNNNSKMIGPAAQMNAMNQFAAISCVQCGEVHLLICAHTTHNLCAMCKTSSTTKHTILVGGITLTSHGEINNNKQIKGMHQNAHGQQQHSQQHSNRLPIHPPSRLSNYY